MRRIGPSLLSLLAISALATTPSAASAACLSISLTEGQGFSSVTSVFALSGERILYVQDAEVDDAYEIWSAPLANHEPPVRLSDIRPVGTFGPAWLKVSPDGQRALFLLDQDTASQNELFSVPITGPANAAVRLNGALAADEEVGGTAICCAGPDQHFSLVGDTVAFWVRKETSPGVGHHDLHTSRIDGIEGAAFLARVGLDTPSGKTSLTPDERHVVFSARLPGADRDGIYRALVGGGGSVVDLTPSLAAGTSIGANWKVSPDGTYAVYQAFPSSGPVELYSVPIAGGPAEQMNSLLPEGGRVGGFAISPDSQWVVYRADQQVDEKHELFAVPIAGGSPQRLNPALPADGDVRVFAVTPDSARAVFVAGQEGSRQLYSSVLATGASARLSTLPLGGNVLDGLELTPDGAHAVYMGETTFFGTTRGLYAARVDGSDARFLASLTTELAAQPLAMSPDSRSVAFMDLTGNEGQRELFTVPVLGGDVEQVHPELASDLPGVQAFRYAPGPVPWLVFRLDIDRSSGTTRRDLFTCGGIFSDGFESGTTERWSS